MPIVRINKPAYAKFTGKMGDVDFVNGVSVESISMSETRRLGAVLPLVDVEDDAPLGVTQEMTNNRKKNLKEIQGKTGSASKGERAKSEAEAEAEAEKQAEKQTAPKPEPKRTRPCDFTRADLEKVADEDGIVGIRQFAKKHDTVGKSIKECIDRLMVKKEALESVQKK